MPYREVAASRIFAAAAAEPPNGASSATAHAATASAMGDRER